MSAKHDLRNIQLPKVTDGGQFEHLCRDLWHNEPDTELVQPNGRPGQRQQGVDVFGRYESNQEWFGIQCKSRSTDTRLTQNDIIREITQAQNFNPKLSEFIICTNLDRDAKIQEACRLITTNILSKDSFRLRVVFWDDIEEKLKDEANFNVLHKYYNKFFVDSTTLGFAIGKLLNLELGEGDSTDTHYEIMIGKIPGKVESAGSGVNYYRGTYFLVNFHERKFDTFPVPCFDSDLEQAVTLKYDRFRITKWLNSIDDLDGFISSDEEDVSYRITDQDRAEFLESLGD